MDITMLGLQNAGKTSILRVLAVSTPAAQCFVCECRLTDANQGGEFTIE
jgi:hypothetical protein